VRPNRTIVTCFFLIFWAAVSGCTTLADAKLARGTGESRLYPVSADAIWSILPEVVRAAGLDYVDGNRPEGYALAQHSMDLLTYGENVAIFVDPGNDVFDHASRNRIKARVGDKHNGNQLGGDDPGWT
jgi:hypothetical protein